MATALCSEPEAAAQPAKLASPLTLAKLSIQQPTKKRFNDRDERSRDRSQRVGQKPSTVPLNTCPSLVLVPLPCSSRTDSERLAASTSDPGRSSPCRHHCRGVTGSSVVTGSSGRTGSSEASLAFDDTYSLETDREESNKLNANDN